MKYVLFNNSEYFGDKCPEYFLSMKEAFESKDARSLDLFKLFDGEDDFDKGEYDPVELKAQIDDSLIVLNEKEFKKMFKEKI